MIIKLYEELVKLCMAKHNTGWGIWIVYQAKTWGGGESFTLPGLWIYEGPQANDLGRGTEMEQANSLHAWQEGLSLLNTLLETINAHLYRYQR